MQCSSQAKRVNVVTNICHKYFVCHMLRSLLRSLSPEEYSDVTAFLAQYPCVEMSVTASVEDDHDTARITAGALVTVTVKLTRKPMLVGPMCESVVVCYCMLYLHLCGRLSAVYRR